MLVLSRNPGESIIIDGGITVKVIEVRGGVVRLGIEAPRDIPVFRSEVLERMLATEVTLAGACLAGN
jgi:carbon storage regulator